MKKIVVFFFCFILFPFSASAYEILTFGDSITKGYPYVLKTPNGAQVGGYQPYLKTFLANTNTPSSLYNWGVGGETTIGGVSRISSVLNSRFAHFMLLMEGANDVYYGISYSTTATNIGVMIDKIKAKKVIPVIGTITPNTYSPSNANFLIENYYNPRIVAKALSRNVKIADQYAALRSNWRYLTYDGLHPNYSGYDRVARTWYYVISGFYNIQVSVIPAGSGTVTGGGKYSLGATVTVSATANAGYVFTNWTENGDTVSSENEYTFTVTSDHSLVANFRKTATNGALILLLEEEP